VFVCFLHLLLGSVFKFFSYGELHRQWLCGTADHYLTKITFVDCVFSTPFAVKTPINSIIKQWTNNQNILGSVKQLHVLMLVLL